MKVKLVSIENGIAAFGFRRIASLTRNLNPATEIYFITAGNLYSLTTHLFPSTQRKLSEQDLDAIAEELAEADLLCFSAMSPSALYVEEIASAVKQKNPGIFIFWGGTHCIISPEEAIKHVDAICTGEGEVSFPLFYQAFVEGRDYTATPNMWFRTEKGIIKNKNQTLCTSQEFDSFPHMFYGLDCQIYDWKAKQFRQFTKNDYIEYNGLSYKTIWTIGCPFSCTYCANDAFLKLDRNYARIRYPSVDYILREIESAIRNYPFISTILFYDDNFTSLPLDILKLFSEQYKKRIGLPFMIAGLHPNLITEEKIALLAEAGMNRGRMGIQSGNKKTLGIFNRNCTLEKIKESAGILAAAARKYKMIPPAFDIISDNPWETREDIIQTLKFLYELKRPYTLTVLSLRLFPNTKLWDYCSSDPAIDI
ncbi:MAG: radical SAM protein, partial [archaeon]